MKKTLAILLALVMALGLATSAMALSWNAPGASSSASPFAIEVIKLAANADVTGSKYYTTLNDAAAYNFSTVYYAIKLSLPSYADANSYYGSSDLRSGSLVKVTINYTNVDGKSKDVVNVPLKSVSQTLWYNGSAFEGSWVPALNCQTGCGNQHILSAVAVGSQQVSIKASVSGKGSLDDVKIDGCYTVKSETRYGVRPCSKCAPQDMKGFWIEGNCSAYGVFFRVNSANKVTNIYVYDRCQPNQVTTENTFVKITEKLYRWEMVGAKCYTCRIPGLAPNTAIASYDLLELPTGSMLTKGNNMPDGAKLLNSSVATSDGYFNLYCQDAGVPERLLPYGTGNNAINNYDAVYYEDDDGLYQPVRGTESFWGTQNVFYSKGRSNYTGSTPVGSSGDANKYYAYNTTGLGGSSYLQYGNIYRLVGAQNVSELYEMTSATSVSCDGNEKSYLNVANYVMSLLGFTYADFAAGNIYMTTNNFLSNFGFLQGASAEAVWGAYTASITVAPIAEVPATGSISFMGFIMIALAVVATVVNRKARAHN